MQESSTTFIKITICLNIRTENVRSESLLTDHETGYQAHYPAVKKT